MDATLVASVFCSKSVTVDVMLTQNNSLSYVKIMRSHTLVCSAIKLSLYESIILTVTQWNDIQSNLSLSIFTIHKFYYNRNPLTMIKNKRENSVAYNYIGIECGYRGTMHLW